MSEANDAQAWRLHQAQEMIDSYNARKDDPEEVETLIGVVMPPVTAPESTS